MLLDSIDPLVVANNHPMELAKILKDTSPITGADVAATLGIGSPGTASEYKTEALALIGRGYNHHTGYDPDRTAQ